MQTFICTSEDVDSNAAVEELLGQIEERAKSKPKGAIIYMGIDHDHKLILDTLLNKFEGLQIIGCTTDGEISSTHNFTEDSITACFFCGDTIEAKAFCAKDISKDMQGSVERAIAELNNKKPSFMFTTPESLTVSIDKVLRKVQNTFLENTPVFGGTAGDQWRYETTKQFFQGESLSDSAPFLAFFGDLNFTYGVETGWEGIGKVASLSETKDNIVYKIDDKPAKDFYNELLGEHQKPSAENPLKVFENDGSVLRAPMLYGEDGSIRFGGDVKEGSKVQLTECSRDSILSGTRKSIKTALDKFDQKEPEAVLLISCASRKQVLGTRAKEEIEIVKEELKKKFPEKYKEISILGFYSNGEVCPLTVKEGNRFHNETFISLVVG